MTPHGHRLEHLLRVERERMRNEWFFKWHFIGKDGPVEIDGFDGRKIRYGGIKFWGTPREVYWHTLNRYARRTIDQVFQEAEQAIASYPLHQAINAVEDIERNLTAFLAQVAQDAVEKDRILRGNGIEFPEHDRGKKSQVLLLSEIGARALALRTHLEAVHGTRPPTDAKRDTVGGGEVVLIRPSVWGIGIDLRALWRRIRAVPTSREARPNSRDVA